MEVTCAPADISYPTDLKLLKEAKLGTLLSIHHPTLFTIVRGFFLLPATNSTRIAIILRLLVVAISYRMERVYIFY